MRLFENFFLKISARNFILNKMTTIYYNDNPITSNVIWKIILYPGTDNIVKFLMTDT